MTENTDRQKKKLKLQVSRVKKSVTMTAISCLYELFVVSSTEIQIFTVLYILLSISSWIFAPHFLYLQYKYECNPKHKRRSTTSQDSVASIIHLCGNLSITCTNRHQMNTFHVLMAVTVFLTAAATITLAIMGLQYVHIIYPDERIDYSHICDKHDFSFYEIWHFIFPFGSFLIDITYVLLLVIYYLRLIIIFQGSLYEIPNSKKYIFVISIIVTLIAMCCVVLFEIIDIFRAAATSYMIFLIFYTITAFHLCYVLKRQFGYLINPCLKNESQKCKALRFVKIMKKFTILICVALFFTLFNFFFYFIWFGILYNFAFDPNNNGVFLAWFLSLLIDNNVNILCIGAQFEYNSFFYHLCCQKYENLKILQQIEESVKSIHVIDPESPQSQEQMDNNNIN